MKSIQKFFANLCNIPLIPRLLQSTEHKNYLKYYDYILIANFILLRFGWLII
jgi:hypothetical protein